MFIELEKSRSVPEPQQIYNKLIFDAINESIQDILNQRKKPWTFSHRLQRVNPNQKLSSFVQEKVSRWLGEQSFKLDNVADIVQREEKEDIERDSWNHEKDEAQSKYVFPLVEDGDS